VIALKIVLVTAMLFACAGALAQQSQGAPPEQRESFDPSRDAAKDIQAALRQAEASGRRVILDVGGEWCIWCRRLDSLFASHPEIEEYRRAHFVTVKVNWSPENKNEQVLSHYPKVAGYPHLFVLESDGTLLKSQDTGELEKGKGHDPEKVMAFLKKWAPSK